MDPQTIKAYNQHAEEYDSDVAIFWEQFPRSFIEMFLKNSSGKEVLNIGSGSGRDAELLRDNGKEVLCLDASSTMIEITKKKGFQSIEGDLRKLPFSDHSVESVWAYTSLLHIPKKELSSALKEIDRVLKKCGVIAIGLIEGDTEGYVSRSEMNEKRYFAYYSKQEILHEAEKAGWKLVHFESFKPRSKTYLNFLFKKS